MSEVQKEKDGLSQNTWIRVEGTYELREVADFVTGAVFALASYSGCVTGPVSALINLKMHFARRMV